MTAPTWHILGAGAMGTLFHHLCLTSEISSVLLNHRVLRESRSICLGESRWSYAVSPLAELPNESIDRLILATKAPQVGPATHMILPLLAPNATIVCLANGLGWERELPNNSPPIARALTTAGAYRDEHGTVHVVSTGETKVGVMNKTRTAPVWFSDSLHALPDWNWATEIASAVHRKFAINCVINPLTAALECRNGELISNAAYAEKLRALCDECQPALEALEFWKEDESLYEAASAVCEATADNRSSMLQDVLAQRSTEMGYLGGELVSLSRGRAIDLPTMTKLSHQLA
ncbi:MAG: 2-dehydropantoate 2-reductase [Pseudomonadota bacterium]